MRTTVALDTDTRDRLLDLKRRWGQRGVDGVIRRLLDGTATGARPLYVARRATVDAALARHGITRLVAFGSRARGDARPDSDIDLAVALPAAADLMDLVHVQDDLAAAFGVPANVVTLDGADERLAREIERDGVTLVP